MDPSTALFDQYDADYCTRATAVASRIDELPGLSGDARLQAARAIATDLAECDALVGRLELEARAATPAGTAGGATAASARLAKARQYKADAAALRARAARAGATGGGADAGTPADAAARAELGLGGGSGGGGGGWAAGGGGGGANLAAPGAVQRDAVLSTTARLERAGDRLAQGRAQLLQTEELGVSILSDLHRQRETIAHAHETLHGTDDALATARRLLGTMSRRASANKAIAGAVIAVLAASILLILWAKIFR